MMFEGWGCRCSRDKGDRMSSASNATYLLLAVVCASSPLNIVGHCKNNESRSEKEIERVGRVSDLRGQDSSGS